MAFINRKTFDVIQSLNRTASPDEWFQADDMLADTLQVLNMRGYTTISSQTALPYCRTNETVIRNVRDSSGRTPAYDKIAAAFCEKFPGSDIMRIDRIGLRDFRLILREHTPGFIEIVFEQDINFPELPEGFEYGSRSLRHQFDPSLSGFELLDIQVRFCRELFNWSCNLPLNIIVKKS